MLYMHFNGETGQAHARGNRGLFTKNTLIKQPPIYIAYASMPI